jgi:hypothetical protein
MIAAPSTVKVLVAVRITVRSKFGADSQFEQLAGFRLLGCKPDTAMTRRNCPSKYHDRLKV